ncbi:hypothetical protein LINPERPRIM_LOCUS23685 [Linum perenne]
MPSFSHAYDHSFRTKEILDFYQVDTNDFVKYGVSPAPLIFNLGWHTLAFRAPGTYCEEAVKYFYCNLRVHTVDPPTSSTIVFGKRVPISPSVLASVLGIPIAGSTVHTVAGLHQVGWDIQLQNRLLCQVPTNARRVEVFQIPETLRVLHWYVTRVFLPHSSELDLITPIDGWILFGALRSPRLSLPHLVLFSIIQAATPQFQGHLPFASVITTLLFDAGVDLSDHVLQNNCRVLRPQHVLR